MRTEKDFLGELKIPSDSLYGIQSLRAKENFPDQTRFHPEWYRAMALVKKACYLTVSEYSGKVSLKTGTAENMVRLPSPAILDVLAESASECSEGIHFDQFIVPAVSGGAGTSINMNINEILANLALLKLGHRPGEYDKVDPLEDANIFQSTNDVVPTALRVASMQLLNRLGEEINSFRAGMELREEEFRDVLRVSYTQMQEAVPTTFGRLFSTYCDALSRDWWRISRCLERIKVVNLGGSAVGTSIAVPKYFVVEVVKALQHLSDLPLTRGENLSDATSNLDPLVEVHGILKTHAVNLEKIVSDLRLLSSDIHESHEIGIPKKQVGSTIMPGKVNPVIPEFVISAAHRVYSNDQLITSLSAQGCLELNAYLPVIGHAFLESLKLLIACNTTCRNNLVEGLKVNAEPAILKLMKSPSTATSLLPYIGYKKASELAHYMKEHNLDIFQANAQLNLIIEEKLRDILKPDNLVQGAYRLKDLGKK